MEVSILVLSIWEVPPYHPIILTDTRCDSWWAFQFSESCYVDP